MSGHVTCLRQCPCKFESRNVDELLFRMSNRISVCTAFLTALGSFTSVIISQLAILPQDAE